MVFLRKLIDRLSQPIDAGLDYFAHNIIDENEKIEGDVTIEHANAFLAGMLDAIRNKGDLEDI